jgi:hypothetical protein
VILQRTNDIYWPLLDQGRQGVPCARRSVAATLSLVSPHWLKTLLGDLPDRLDA